MTARIRIAAAAAAISVLAVAGGVQGASPSAGRGRHRPPRSVARAARDDRG